jgi:cytochrome c553
MTASFRLAGLGVLALVLLAALATGAVWLISDMQLNQHVVVPSRDIPIPTDVGAVQQGQHLAGAITLCVECHGSTMAGAVIEDDSTARIVAPNVTRDGVKLSDADRIRAIRDGIDPTGRQLLLMPSDAYYYLSDADVAAIVAYLDALAPAPNSLPSSEIRPLGRLRFVAGRVELLPSANIDRTAPRPTAPPIDVTPAYGQYLVNIAGCARCHGQALNRPDITSVGLGDWSDADFLSLMRNGRLPGGRQVTTAMPWRYYAQMSELELRAIWDFLQVLPPH